MYFLAILFVFLYNKKIFLNRTYNIIYEHKNLNTNTNINKIILYNLIKQNSTGYDERYPINSNSTENMLLFLKIKKNIKKLKILSFLQDKDISMHDKLNILYKPPEITSINFLAGGLLDEINEFNN
jgi:hypothetical protein